MITIPPNDIWAATNIYIVVIHLKLGRKRSTGGFSWNLHVVRRNVRFPRTYGKPYSFGKFPECIYSNLWKKNNKNSWTPVNRAGFWHHRTTILEMRLYLFDACYINISPPPFIWLLRSPDLRRFEGSLWSPVTMWLKPGEFNMGKIIARYSTRKLRRCI